MQLDFAALHLLPDGLAVAEKPRHARKDVHVDSMRSDVVSGGVGAKFLLRLRCDRPQALQELLECGLLCWIAGLCGLLRIEHHLRCAHHGATLGVPQDQDELRSERADAILQATHNAALRMRERVAGVAEHEDVAWLAIEHDLNGRPGVCATKDGHHRILAVHRQCLAMLRFETGRRGSGLTHKPLVSLAKLLQGPVGGRAAVVLRAHAVRVVRDLTLHLSHGTKISLWLLGRREGRA
mmetsp:Transcript_30226/g.76106  ORF Transcript_30226/g.76106 Transcript_30226/m.76106 type:complete len:238 (+) Transcript_30226:490-1203(+)